jgi:uncharacterized protein YlzI (FlbEa/FlbD family)
MRYYQLIEDCNELLHISDDAAGHFLNEVAVVSSWIEDLEYDDGDTYMTLNSGRVYVIKDTLPDVFEDWLEAPSKGKFWHSDIKDMYDVRRAG